MKYDFDTSGNSDLAQVLAGIKSALVDISARVAALEAKPAPEPAPEPAPVKGKK